MHSQVAASPLPMSVLDVALLLFALFLPEVAGQTTHVVTVGVEGSFYSPPTISAGLNDTVMFIFGGDAHTVTQSSFESPCIRLAGGFDSGFNGRGADFSNPAPVWSLRITNVSETIWYFCQASIPSSHCFSGMVGCVRLLRREKQRQRQQQCSSDGAINPPSILMYNEFVSAARLVTGTPKPSPSFIASGQGAFATNSPIPSSISMTSPPVQPTSTAPSAPATLVVLSSTSHILGLAHQRRARRGLRGRWRHYPHPHRPPRHLALAPPLLHHRHRGVDAPARRRRLPWPKVPCAQGSIRPVRREHRRSLRAAHAHVPRHDLAALLERGRGVFRRRRRRHRRGQAH
ncbi:hypothetical protein C8R46DRAFT_265845 [Mycena filopes]|nr:hypothetical protein C8R46DRAFT_265845 [Mycena filopes]